MKRNEMVEERTEALNKLSDKELAGEIVSYFENNHTMPGEKNLKDRAGILLGELEEGTITGVTSEIRKDLIEEFVSVLIKETKIKGKTVKNAGKKAEGKEGIPVTELPLDLADSMPMVVPVNTRKDIYEMPVIIGEDGSITTDTKNPVKLGELGKGFRKNHETVSGMKATVVATDYSNGKFANMSYKVLIDLGQKAA